VRDTHDAMRCDAMRCVRFSFRGRSARTWLLPQKKRKPTYARAPLTADRTPTAGALCPAASGVSRRIARRGLSIWTMKRSERGGGGGGGGAHTTNNARDSHRRQHHRPRRRAINMRMRTRHLNWCGKPRLGCGEPGPHCSCMGRRHRSQAACPLAATSQAAPPALAVGTCLAGGAGDPMQGLCNVFPKRQLRLWCH